MVTVEKRARDTVVGQLRFDGEVFFVAPMDEKLPSKILITDEVSEHKDKIVGGQLVEEGQYPTRGVLTGQIRNRMTGFL